jgi:hypothetical protein
MTPSTFGGSPNAGGAVSTGGGSFFDPVGGRSGSGDAQCGAVSSTAEQVIVETPVYEYRPVALNVMQDRSSSMVGVLGNPNGWPDAYGAMTAFANDPASAGLDVQLGFFPPVTTNAGACDGSDCGAPVVPWGPLPQNAQPIINAYNTAAPPTIPPLLTPTECALRGATIGCAQYQAQYMKQCVVVLVTDGEPTVCNTDTAFLSQIAADALRDWNVLTFAIGMDGSNFNTLDAIAQAGGTDCDPNGPRYACIVAGGSQQTAFLDALNLIRQTVTSVQTRIDQTVVPCEWDIPPAPAGETFDATKVNVEFRAGTAMAQQIGAVPSPAECAAAGGGWYYDDPLNPTKVQVCEQTCSVITATPDARVDVLFGCETVFAVM